MESLFQLMICVSFVCWTGCLATGLNDKDATILKLVNTVEALNRKMEMMETKMNVLEQKNQRLEKRQAETIDTPVAFTATLSQSDKTLGYHQTVEYDHVITNLGNGYDPRHGHFTCPVKGLYLFAVTVLSSSRGSHALYTEVVKNGNRVTRLYNTITEASSTTSVFLITLEVGEMVWVRSLNSEIIHGYGYDSFAGTLIYQMQ